MRSDIQRDLFLKLIDDAFDHKAWHGPNLRGAIRRVTPGQAGWRPAPARHNIAEIVLHCAYWKYAVRRRIRGDKRGSFPMKGSNWFALPEARAEAQWRDLVRLLDDQHALLREAIAGAPAVQFTRAGGTKSAAARLYGIAMHDVYHAGQIQTIKAMSNNR